MCHTGTQKWQSNCRNRLKGITNQKVSLEISLFFQLKVASYTTNYKDTVYVQFFMFCTKHCRLPSSLNVPIIELYNVLQSKLTAWPSILFISIWCCFIADYLYCTITVIYGAEKSHSVGSDYLFCAMTNEFPNSESLQNKSQIVREAEALLSSKHAAIELLACVTISSGCTLGYAMRDGWDWKYLVGLILVLCSPIVTRTSVEKPTYGFELTRICADPLGLSAGVALLPGTVGAVCERSAIAILSSAFWVSIVAVFGIRLRVTAYAATIALFFSTPFKNAAVSLAASGAPFFAYLLLVSCQRSFSVSEAAAVAAAMSAALSTGCQILLEHRGPVLEQGNIDYVVSLGLAGCVLIWVFSVLPCAATKPNCFDMPHKEIVMKQRAFWTGFSFCSVILITYFTVWLKGTSHEPILWVVTFVSRRNGWGLVLLWITVMAVIIAVARPGKGNVEKAVARKFYHLVAALVFGVGLVVDIDLVRLGAVVGLGLLSLGEAGRVIGHGKVSRFVTDMGKRLVDERDSGVIAVTHMYLLLGCAVPIWMADGAISHAGIVSVCIQDAVAAAIGKRLGTHKWGRRGRTLEGSFAGFTAATIAMIVCGKASLASASLAAAATAVVEAYTEQIDNWVVPMTFTMVIAAAH